VVSLRDVTMFGGTGQGPSRGGYIVVLPTECAVHESVAVSCRWLEGSGLRAAQSCRWLQPVLS